MTAQTPEQAAESAFWAWMGAYADEPHNATYEAADMERAFGAGREGAAQEPQPAPGPCPGCESLRRQHAETCGEAGILAGALRRIAGTRGALVDPAALRAIADGALSALRQQPQPPAPVTALLAILRELGKLDEPGPAAGILREIAERGLGGASRIAEALVCGEHSCDAEVPDPDDEEFTMPCDKLSRFVVSRSDGDTSFGAGGGAEEACEEHLAEVAAGMVGGDEDVRAVVAIRWDACAEGEAAP